MKVLRFALLCAAALSASACTLVQPWEKGSLARADMRFDGDRLEVKYADHVYTSRENASGGAGVGGGGCGCN